MISELMGHKDYIRVLQVLRGGGNLRFGRIEKLLKLNPVQVDRALKFLRKESLVSGRVVPQEKGRSQVEYGLAPRGEAFLDAFDAFSGDIYRRRGQLGASEVAEFRALYQPAGHRSPAPAGKIARVLKISPLPQSETAAARDYRAACLKLSPRERIERMRRHSRQMILLNPGNPRSPHIARGVIRIIHDAF